MRWIRGSQCLGSYLRIREIRLGVRIKRIAGRRPRDGLPAPVAVGEVAVVRRTADGLRA
jgi:hypothetical protein